MDIFIFTDIIPRILTAAILSGLIGFEREHMRRPAGARTHVLVGVAAALVMVIAEYMNLKYGNISDPTRLGAQVISGIGFLGAGTIIKSGYNVKGLTTAASLWATSCIGLAAGAGFYSGAIIATLVIFATLQLLGMLIKKHSQNKILSIHFYDATEGIIKVRNELERAHIYVNHIQVMLLGDGKEQEYRLLVTAPSDHSILEYSVARIREMQEVCDIYVE